MKRYLVAILWLLAVVGVKAQSSFPVQVTNQFDPIPVWAYGSGIRNNAYTMQFVTRSQVESALNSSIGHIYALNGVFAPPPGKAAVIRGYTLQSTRQVTMQVLMGAPTGVLAGANIPTASLAVIVDSSPVYISTNWIVRNPRSVFIYCLNFMRAADTAAWIAITPDVYYITDDFNYNAKKVISWVGTSITAGTGTEATGFMYHTLFKDSLRSLGVSARNELNGISGSTSATHYTLFTQGTYDRTSNDAPPDALIIECAVNDASAGVSASAYTGRLRLYAERFLKNPDNKKINVIILGATPLGNTTAYNNSVVLDAAAAVLVSQLNVLYPNRIFFMPLADAFPRTDRSYYISSDVVGQEIHPNNLGQQAIMNNKIAAWMATAAGQTFISNMKK